MTILLLMIALLVPSWAWAEGTLTPAANPPQPETVISVSGIPFIKASSGTMGNNGAVSAMTALPRTFSGGAYLMLPAGAIAAGVPAASAWYWFVASSTTAGTVYNSTYTSGIPVPGTLTAFATTGPGAFTGITINVSGPVLTIPANLMGKNGRLESRASYSEAATVGAKGVLLTFGSTDCYSISTTSAASLSATCDLTNRGVTNIQTLNYTYATSGAGAANVTQGVDSAEATTANVTLTFKMNVTGVATDHIILESHRVIIISGN